MSKTTNFFRIHPAIGFARVGTSAEFNSAPETVTGSPPAGGSGPTGGLPLGVVPQTFADTGPVTDADLRDGSGALKRQAARFRIYMYDEPKGGDETYPLHSDYVEVTVGATITCNGKKQVVQDILWQVHSANKKAAWYQSPDDDGIIAWNNGNTPPLRNPSRGTDPNSPTRLTELTIDPGPRVIRGTDRTSLELSVYTNAEYVLNGQIQECPDYPIQFPFMSFGDPANAGAQTIKSLGTIATDPLGRLYVAGGYGIANSILPEAPNYGFTDAVNNDNWFDDTSDGVVTATILFASGDYHKVEGHAWVISTDPAYAPQIRNAVTLWDDIYDSFIRKLALRPDIYKNGAFNRGYKPAFSADVQPMFQAAGLQQWITNLNAKGIGAHAQVAAIKASTAPSDTQLHGMGFIREPVDPNDVTPVDPSDPNAIVTNSQGEVTRGDPAESGDSLRMPLSLGDAGRSLLSLTATQYQMMSLWDGSRATGNPLRFTPGETLDQASLAAGLGGRFSPGIDMTYICREPDLYRQNWQEDNHGPFRINLGKLDYSKASKNSPFLTLGWIPRRNDPNNVTLFVEPGDVSKFMALPWHADYNSCGTHIPSPNPASNNTLFWSWPAQRPVAVYVASDVKNSQLPKQRFSVRGPGTKTSVPPGGQPPAWGPENPAEVGRYQQPATPNDPGTIRVLDNWMKIGTVIQATNIRNNAGLDPASYLEVQSQLSTEGQPGEDPNNDIVVPWPTTVPPGSQ